MRYFKPLFIIVLTVLSVAACSNKNESDSIEKQQQNEGVFEASPDTMAASNTIVSVASKNPNLSMLVKALTSAGRVDMLNSDGPYTVFAPSNKAFGTLPEGTVADLMKPENKQKLGNILAYHVVEGSVMASDLEDGQTIATVQGTKLTVTKKNGTVMVNGAAITETDISASNGVLHVINKVLMPSNNQ